MIARKRGVGTIIRLRRALHSALVVGSFMLPIYIPRTAAFVCFPVPPLAACLWGGTPRFRFPARRSSPRSCTRPGRPTAERASAERAGVGAYTAQLARLQGALEEGKGGQAVLEGELAALRAAVDSGERTVADLTSERDAA
eukprot:4466987-Pyramimonas_sp.AAC.1